MHFVNTALASRLDNKDGKMQQLQLNSTLQIWVHEILAYGNMCIRGDVKAS